MENFSSAGRTADPVPSFDNGLSAGNRFRRWRHAAIQTVRRVTGRVRLFEVAVSCLGIWIAYLAGIHVSGHFHASSRWMGAMLACTSVVAVLQKGTYRDSLKAGWTRVAGTFIGAAVGYIYLRVLPFSVAGMLGMIAVLESVLMLLKMYANSQMAVVTLLIIMLVSKMSPDADPAVNCMLRFFESAVGAGVGISLLWVIERWNSWRHQRREHRAHRPSKTVNISANPRKTESPQ